MITIFDRRQVARQRLRAAADANRTHHEFLFDWAVDQLADRLSVVRRNFPACLQIGARGKPFPYRSFGGDWMARTDCAGIRDADILCEEDFLPFADSSLDLIVSSLNFHSINDLPGALLQMRRALKPDGLLLAAMMGGETLHELRECLQEAELDICGGTSPRVFPFADKPQMGGLLQRAGFALPVVDSDIITVTYQSIFHLMKDLRMMGEGNAVMHRSKTFLSRQVLLRAGEIYAERYAEADSRIRASFEIIFLLGWAPHDNQQKPLRPGEAKTRLADWLGTTEIGAGEKPH